MRDALASAAVSAGDLVLVGLSGGADSLALAAGAAFEGLRAGIRVGAVIIDHGLQDASATTADRAREQAVALGLDPVVVKRVEVATPSGTGGPENAAREARYAAFAEVLADVGASHLLLAHTLDDQAETVLLGLARGSGAASLQGMAPESGSVLRPLLGIRRQATRQACIDAGLEPWDDPHNLDRSYTRVRVRHDVLPVLERELGPGVAEALARTAEQLREDSQAFDEMIEEVRRIVAVTDLPVTADLEGGYGDPAETVRKAIGVGVVGANLEDQMRPLAEAAARVEAVMRAAQDAGVPDFVLNARTDAFVKGVDNALEEAVARGRAFLDAGAPVVFVPGRLDEAQIGTLVDAFGPQRLTLIGIPGVPSLARLQELGVARVSWGPMSQNVALTALAELVEAVHDGGGVPASMRILN